MIKLFVDPISHLVTGYEFLSEYSIRYMDDIVLTEEESLNFKLVHGETYYENEKIIYEKDRDNYHKEIAQLKEELARTSVKTKEELLSNFILNDDMTDIVKIKSKVNDEYNKNNKKREELKIKINNITENHFNAIDNYYRNLSKQKDDAVNPIYKTSICLLAKDEDLYIEEWVNHYINLGFEHIYIYDNGSKNPINDFIKSHFNKEIQKKITVINFSEKTENIQSDCYNKFLKDYGKKTRWCAFIDIDEFIMIGDGYNNIDDFLNNYKDATTIYVDFIEYGADGKFNYSPEPVVERFTTPVEIKRNYAKKVIVKPYKIDRFDTHYPVFDNRINIVANPSKEEVTTHHYYTKSFEEWKSKIERGSCDPNWLRHYREFFAYNPDMSYLDTGEDILQKYE